MDQPPQGLDTGRLRAACAAGSTTPAAMVGRLLACAPGPAVRISRLPDERLLGLARSADAVLPLGRVPFAVKDDRRGGPADHGGVPGLRPPAAGRRRAAGGFVDTEIRVFRGIGGFRWDGGSSAESSSRKAVRLVKERGVSAVQASRDLDVGGSILRRWIKELAAGPSCRRSHARR